MADSSIRMETLQRAASLCPRTHSLHVPNELERKWRVALYEAFRLHNFNFYDPCNLTELFHPATIKILTSYEKGSTSDSVIVAGTMQYPRNQALSKQYREFWNNAKCDVIVKVSFPRLYFRAPRGQTSPMQAEVLIYEFLTKLVRYNVTPNLMIALGHYDCTFRQLSQNTDEQVFNRLFDEARGVHRNRNSAMQMDDSVRLLVLERGRGKSLADMLPSLSEDALLSILFQVLYTLAVIDLRGVRHADLHFRNVFVDRLSDVSTRLAYFPDTAKPVYFDVPTVGFVAKLYDWDWGGVYGSQQNVWPRPNQNILNAAAVEMCAEVSSCNRNSKADAFILLSNLADAIQPTRFPRVHNFLNEVIDPRLLKFGSPMSQRNFGTSGGFKYRLCQGPVVDACKAPNESILTGKQCNGPFNPSNCLMKSPADMLMHPLFTPLFKDASKDPPRTRFVYGNWKNEAQYKDFSTRYHLK